jgi:hypothetical protein
MECQERKAYPSDVSEFGRAGARPNSLGINYPTLDRILLV